MSAVPAVPALYFHVPFCAHKCEYCAFYSAPPTGDIMDRYVKALVLEMERVCAHVKPRTLYFGGGTPSLLTLGQWETIVSAIHRLEWHGATEWTVECNPATITEEKARLLRQAGVNRMSMGVQSFEPALLERLGRIHTREMAFKTWEVLRSAGFDNLNLDLMFAIPGQTMELWKQTLAEAMAMNSEHLSTYEVIYEEDTPLYEQLQAGEFDSDEDLACAMYEELVDTSSAHGFHQYEVANFARTDASGSFRIPSRACRHNVNYWRGGFFLGFGPSAAAYLDGVRTKNWSNTTLYCECLEQKRSPVETTDRLEPVARAGEIAAFGLRMNDGWPFDEFIEATGFDLRIEWKDEMQQLIAQGMAESDERGFRLNRKGLRFADSAAELFLRI